MEQLNSGMNQDANPIYQPKGTTRFNLNTVIDDRNAEQGQIVSDEGNELCVQFDDASLIGYSLIGSHRLADNSKLLFLTDNIHSVIGIQTECNFEIIVNADCLNFKTTKRISILSRVINGCERVIYFTDTYNSYRSINIDSLEQYLLSGETIASANLSGTGWDCALFKHFYDYNFPRINLVQVNDNGGRLRYGTYSFSFRYVDNQNNNTNWIPLSSMIPITAGPQSVDINLEDWYALQGDTNDNEFSTTNKSISLNLSNLDLRFSRFQLAVVEYVENIKVPTNYYILEQIAFNSASYDYTYSGFNQLIHSAGTLNELTIPTVSIDTVHAHAQNAGRLFLSNVKEYERDWTKFQQAACKIKSSWFANSSNNYNSSYQTIATKRYNYYFDQKSYMRDEIYAFGIVYVFKDGSQSPVFHIPGTAADNPDRLADLATFQANPHNRQNGGTLVDRELLTVVTTPSSQSALEVAEADVRHMGLVIGDTVERWKVFNTAIEKFRIPYLAGINVGPKNHFSAGGLMAFWECESSTYSEVQDCNGDYIFDTDYYGNTLAGTPIRHHKFPDATLVEHAFASREVSGSGVFTKIHEILHSRLGISFDNISVPAAFASEVQGYYIVRVQRNKLTSTVVDKGMFNNTVKGIIYGGTTPILYNPSARGGFNHGTGIGQDDGKQGCLLSSMSLQGTFSGADWVREAAKGDYVKFESVMKSFYDGILFSESYFTDIENPFLNTTNRRLNDSVLVASNRRATGVGFQHDLFNNNWMNDINFISYEDSITHLPFSSPGDIPQFRKVWYVSIKKYYPNLMDNLNGLTYIKTHQNIINTATTNISILGGDIFINNYVWAGFNSAGVDDPVPVDPTAPYNDNRFGAIAINLMEEPLNLSLRQWGTETYERHPELRYDTGGTLWFTNPLFFATADMLDPDTDVVKRQWKALNPDYHVEPDLSIFFPVSINHNWCDNCEGKKPNFIYYSDKSSAFDIADNYRVVRALNVENLFPEDGAITGLFIDKDRLFATTANSVIFLPTKPQTLQGDGTTVYTGTGDVLSAPPKKLVSSEIGYAGVEDKFGINVNEFGTVLIDTVRGKVFLLGEGLEEISNHGLRAFFRDNLPFKLKKLIPTLDESNYYTNINGIGLLATYDQKYRRLILHKRDYTPINFGGLLPEIPLPNIIYYVLESDGRLRWYRNDVEIFASNSTYFTNHSFTLSYSFANKCWTSFHSYMPDFMYNDSETFYTFIQGLNTQLQGVWKHGTESLEYYTNPFQHIIEIVLTPNFQTGVYDDVLMSTKALSPAAGNYMQEKNVFFNKIWVYNEIQSSGLKTLLPISETDMGMSVYNNSYSVSNVICRNVEEYWRLQLPRDLVDLTYSGPTATSNWTSILGNFNLVNGYQGYIDKIASGIISTTKLMQNVSRMRSKYVFVRFYFDSQASTRLVTDLAHSNKRPSIR